MFLVGAGGAPNPIFVSPTCAAKRSSDWFSPRARTVVYYLEMASACIFAMRAEEGLVAARKGMEISDHRYDLGWGYGAILSSIFLVTRGSVRAGLELADEARRRLQATAALMPVLRKNDQRKLEMC